MTLFPLPPPICFIINVQFVAQLVKNLPAIWETWVRSLVWEDPLEKGKATHSSILAWRMPWTIQLERVRVRHNWLAFPESSVGKESTCNARDPSSIPVSVNSCHQREVCPLIWRVNQKWASIISTCNVGDLGSTPELGRNPGEGKGYSLQYSGLENSMDCIVHGVTKSQTQLSDFHLHWKYQHFKIKLKINVTYSQTEQC